MQESHMQCFPEGDKYYNIMSPLYLRFWYTVYFKWGRKCNLRKKNVPLTTFRYSVNDTCRNGSLNIQNEKVNNTIVTCKVVFICMYMWLKVPKQKSSAMRTSFKKMWLQIWLKNAIELYENIRMPTLAISFLLACHAGDPISIPGRCICYLRWGGGVP